MLASGQETEWKWYTFGQNMIATAQTETVYSDDFELPGTGVKMDGKVSMLECCRIHFYAEPWCIDASPAGAQDSYVRFSLQANYHELHMEPGTLMSIHKQLARPSVYMVHTESAHYPIGYQGGKGVLFPVVYDMSTPDGHGSILFKGTKIWASYEYRTLHTPWPAGSAAYAWRCLCRIVWVDPTYYVATTISANTDTV